MTGAIVLIWCSRFSSFSWADPSQPFDVVHFETSGTRFSALQSRSQIPTQYSTEGWGDPFSQAAQLRNFTNTHRQSCFSLWKDLSSSINQVRYRALGLLKGHLGLLWDAFYRRLLGEIVGYSNIVVSLSVPLGFPWDSHGRIRDVVRDVVDGWGGIRLIGIDLMEPMDAAILNALRAQHGRVQPPGGPIGMIEVSSLAFENLGLATDQF